MLVAATACTPRKAVDPFALDRSELTVTNPSGKDWTDVQIWLNSYYRVTAHSIPAGTQFKTTLDVFVDGYGRRFDFRRAQVKDLRLDAKLPDGQPIELKKQFEASGLAGALGGKR